LIKPGLKVKAEAEAKAKAEAKAGNKLLKITIIT
jgi:hypothetical protein